MPPHKIFFIGSIFFLLGVALQSFELTTFEAFIINLGIAGVFLVFQIYSPRKNIWLTLVLSVFIILGALYGASYTEKILSQRIESKGSVILQGIVENNPLPKAGIQELIVKEKLSSSSILISVDRYPEFTYGDEIKIEGVLEDPYTESYENYLSVKGITQVMRFPIIEKISEDNGNSLKKNLFKIKNHTINTFQTLLPRTKSALLSGITLGERSEFGEDLKDSMRKSGTTHIVALSGYNITILVCVILGTLTFFMKRQFASVITALIIIGFVVMTGGEASVVRAAIMGLILLLGKESGRDYKIGNAIVCAALFMTLLNPSVLVFDIGFQLSFLALLGIIYIKPVLEKILKLNTKESFLSWKENLLTTTSAQLAVIPLLINYFGSVSVTSILANIMILELIPLTMALGFIIGGLSFFSMSLAAIGAFLVYIPLFVEEGIIRLFAKLTITTTFPISMLTGLLYYTSLLALIVWINKRNK